MCKLKNIGVTGNNAISRPLPSVEAKGKFRARDHGRIQRVETRGRHGLKKTLNAWVYDPSWIWPKNRRQSTWLIGPVAPRQSQELGGKRSVPQQEMAGQVGTWMAPVWPDLPVHETKHLVLLDWKWAADSDGPSFPYDELAIFILLFDQFYVYGCFAHTHTPALQKIFLLKENFTH